MTDRQRNGLILVVVVGLLLASLVVIAGIPGATKPHKTRLGLDLKGGVQLIYEGQPTAQTPKVTPDALSRAVDIMRQRVDQLGVSEPEIQTTGGNDITVGLPSVSNTARAEKLGRGARPQIAARHGDAGACEDLGEATHSDSADADEMNGFNVVQIHPDRYFLLLRNSKVVQRSKQLFSSHFFDEIDNRFRRIRRCQRLLRPSPSPRLRRLPSLHPKSSSRRHSWPRHRPRLSPRHRLLPKAPQADLPTSTE